METAGDLVEYFTDFFDFLQLEQFINEGLDMDETISLEDGVSRVTESTAPCSMDEHAGDLAEFFSDSCDNLKLEGLINKGLNVDAPLSLEDGRRPLHVAGTKGNVDMVKALLDRGVDVDVPDYRGNSALHYAAKEGHEEVVRLLLHGGADPNLTNDGGCTILQNAVCFEHLDVTRCLLLKGAQLNATTSTDSLPPKLQTKKWYFNEKRSLLGVAFELENLPIIHELMLAGADVVAESHKLMFIAIKRNNMELVNLLLEKGADIKRQCINNKTPLDVAISSGWYNLVETFLDMGAEIEERSSLQEALYGGHLEIAKLLIERGAKLSVELVNSSLKKILILGHNSVAEWLFNHRPQVVPSQREYVYFLVRAIETGNIGMVHLIVGRIEDINESSSDGFLNIKETALISATKKKLLPVIELLLEKGADPTMTDTHGDTALLHALRSDQYLEIVKLFMKLGVSANAFVDIKRQSTLLHQATKLCRLDLVELLLLNGADINAQDTDGCTPFHRLFRLDNDQYLRIIKLLVDNGADLYHANKYDKTPVDLIIRDKFYWVFGLSTEISQERVFLQECYKIVEEDLVKVKDLLGGLMQKMHTDLVKFVMQKVIGFYYEEKVLNHDFTIEGSDDEFSSLHCAAFIGDRKLSDTALRNGVDIDALTKDGFSALQIALYKGNTQLAQHLISKGAKVSVVDKLGLLPFHVALLLGYDTLVPQLYFGACLKNYSTSVFGVPVLHLAAYNGSLSQVKFLLSESLNINTKDQNNITILHIAVKIQHCELVDFLLENGIDKNAQDTNGYTALHMAAHAVHYCNASLEIPLSLLRHDADINTTNSTNRTALHLAACTPLAGTLLSKGVRNVNAQSSLGNTPFHDLAGHLQHREEVAFDPTAQVILFLNYNTGYSIRNCIGESPLSMLLLSKIVDLKRIVDSCNVNFSSIMDYDRISLIFIRLNCDKDKQFSEKRQSELLEILLTQGFSLNSNRGGYSPLLNHVMKHIDLFKLVLEYDSQLDLKDVLSKAITEKRFHIIRLVLDKIGVNTSGNLYLNMFFPDQELKYGLAQIFLDRVKVTDTSANYALLIEMAKAEHLLITKALLDKGANINSVDAQSNSALHFAAESGNNRMLHLLLTRGALVDLLNWKNETPIYFAVKSGRFDAFRLLMDQGASLFLNDFDDNTLLHKTTCCEITKTLIEQGFPVNAVNASKRIALHCIVDPDAQKNQFQLQEKEETPKVATLLIEAGAVVNARDKDKRTPLHLAAKNNHPLTTKVLVEHGAGIDLRDKDGRTALHLAIGYSRNDIVEYLLDEGALTDVKDTLGFTPHSMSRYSQATTDIFDYYSLKEKLAGLPIEDLGDLSLSREEEALCLEELERMKLTKVHATFCLFELFSSFQRPMYLFDKEILQSIESFLSSSLLSQFPKYRGILKNTFSRSKRSKCYLTPQALRSVFLKKRKKFFRSLPVVVWMHVLTYLGIEDLENIIESGADIVSDVS